MFTRLVITLIALAVPSLAAYAARFNDSALTMCAINGKFSTSCAESGQDAVYGRDSVNRSPKNGIAGFTFSKLDASGNVLPKNATEWSCVYDEVTGLVWEKKSLDPTNLHYFASQKTYFPKSQTYPSNDIRFYVDAVNTEQYCGYSDWRVPSKDEALSLVSYARSSDGRKYIGGLDRTFFADPLYDEWTRECDVELCALTLFKDGESRLVSRIDTLAYARLVRGQGFVSDSARFIVANAEVKDKVTGVTWSRCAEGQTWLNSTCVGSPNSFTWQQAITIAAERTAATGVTWRLPNIKELMAVGNYPYGADAKAFPNSDAQVRTWSSTASFDPAGMRGSFFGSFGVGGVLISGGVGYVHLVHD